MRFALIVFLCLLSCLSYSQKRAAIFRLDLKGNPGHLKPGDVNVHVRQVIDRNQFLDSNGSVDGAKMEAALAGMIDTNVAVNNDFAFTLRNLNTGASYRISLYYLVKLDTISDKRFYRFRAMYQEVKINSWAFEYKVPVVAACRFDASLQNRTCPRCRHSDKVVPVFYMADAQPDPITGSDYPSIKLHTSMETHTDCDANWYCERDKVSF